MLVQRSSPAVRLYYTYSQDKILVYKIISFMDMIIYERQHKFVIKSKLKSKNELLDAIKY